MKEKLEELIKKYEQILNILIENQILDKDNDIYYPYELDIKNTKKYLKDLKDVLKYRE